MQRHPLILARSLEALARLALYALLWWVLSNGEGWYFGLPLVLLTTAISMHFGRPVAVQLSQLPGFVFFFLVELLMAGWDVARRALTPAMPLKPGWLAYDLQCRSTVARMLLSVLVCLLPGTFSARVAGDQLAMHVLDADRAWEGVARLERRIIRMLESAP